ncbi:unnamed protein product [Gemmataceae bacterium]|nr:unnamed protein product [Gemmataceae bacterium]VTU02828.1 unnamed protein product [Gemmataceae bacterium]
MPTPLRLCATLTAALVSAAAAAACPLCDTTGGERVRAATLGVDFGPNLLLVLLPFPVLLALVAVVYFGLPTAPGGNAGAPDSNLGA